MERQFEYGESVQVDQDRIARPIPNNDRCGTGPWTGTTGIRLRHRTDPRLVAAHLVDRLDR